MRMRGARGGHDLAARGLGLAVGNVLGNGAEEQKRLLQHQPNVAAEVGNRILSNVHAVHQNGALGHVVKAANQVDQRALARAAVAHQANHLARCDFEVDAPVHRPVAIAKPHLAQFNAPLHPVHVHRVLRLGHAGYMVQDVKNALGRRRRLLRDRHDAAHGIEPPIKAPNVGNGRQQHAHGDFALGHLPNAKAPNHQQAHFGQQRHAGRKQRPNLVDAVVDQQVMPVGIAKALGLALLLRKGLDHANARNGVGQHIGDFAPHAVDLLKAGAQPVAHKVNHPANKGQRHQGDERQVRVHGKQDDGGHDDHHHVTGKVGEVQGQIHRNTVAFAAHARKQVAGALAAKVFEREAQQVLVSGGAQVGGNALGRQRQDIRFGPTQHPRQYA